MSIAPAKNGAEKAVSKPNLENNLRASLIESAALLKSYNQLSYFIKDAYIDAMDMNNSWRVAKIHEIDGDILNLVFDGWSRKWDEVI